VKLKYLTYIAASCAVLLLVLFVVAYGVLHASLPQLDGNISEAALSAPVRIERDRLGVPTLQATNRMDLSFATGFVHGQDRFFQMDLSRRLGAGELSELLGAGTLELDKRTRLFRFRRVAREALRLLRPDQRALIDAYARGVNAGLGSLHSRPWEYWALGSAPARWQPEDSFLVMYAMWWDLQASGFHREILRRELNARMGGTVCESGWKCGLRFFYPSRTTWDAPDDDTTGTAAAEATIEVPTADVLDIRRAGNRRDAAPVRAGRDPAAGSNGWAVAGRLTASGAALVADDMHLGQRVPIVWYHARMRTVATETEPALDLNGATLPGTPMLIAGSNGNIAWGFTNSRGVWLDVVQLPCTSIDGDDLHTPSGPVHLSLVREEINVRGAASIWLEVKSGPAGVLMLAHPERQSCWFGSWLAQIPTATNFDLMGLERATSVADALALAPSVGMPHQNLVVGDRAGHIAWSIIGRVPTDTGPARSKGLSPWATKQSFPRIVDPANGRLWTANARVTSDPQQEASIGGDDASLGAQYDVAARARQVRDSLLTLQGPATPADMLRIQLDDRALFLSRWRELLLQLIDADGARDQPNRAEFKRLLINWNARASVDSVGYRLVRAFHDRTQQAVWTMLVSTLNIPTEDSSIADAGFSVPPMQFEESLWRLVTEQPLHMLATEYRSWREFLLAELDATITELQKNCGELSRCTWGSHKIVRIQHPLSGALPLLAGLLDMPPVELPGDDYMPRVQEGAFGASERFAVSPGHEDQGYFHMAGGQSGHPLSPYYRAGFQEWARGEPLPFLPGPAEHMLLLRP
jgi:penicillin amidase